jgi:hypothetical protein
MHVSKKPLENENTLSTAACHVLGIIIGRLGNDMLSRASCRAKQCSLDCDNGLYSYQLWLFVSLSFSLVRSNLQYFQAHVGL